MSLLTCPSCGHVNAADATICSECHSLLEEPSVTMVEDASETLKPVGEAALPTRRAHRQTIQLDADAIALYIGESDEPLIVHITRQAILGRYSPHSSSQPRIDLSSYSAFDKGISRLHAVLRRTTNGLALEDLGSSNGTWVNDARLPNFTASLLKSGDRIRLGQLHMEIYFSSEMTLQE